MLVMRTEIKKKWKCGWLLLPPWRVGRVAGKKIPNPQVETIPLTAKDSKKKFKNSSEGQ